MFLDPGQLVWVDKGFTVNVRERFLLHNSVSLLFSLLTEGKRRYIPWKSVNNIHSTFVNFLNQLEAQNVFMTSVSLKSHNSLPDLDVTECVIENRGTPITFYTDHTDFWTYKLKEKNIN